ncbi:protein big brother-like isoform X4 [Dendronephthya gigantea]|uniref:protein big brother-like isoform X4 n=1 Tax=Dendronephthya gigantea TaxID=151771 RepID=UPI00106C4075|nr:protein big brother-like isoform X4 [Dendronephthya gigantea]
MKRAEGTKGRYRREDVKFSLLMIKMPRVVPDQRSKFENDEMFRKLSRESESFVATGTNICLFFPKPDNMLSSPFINFEQEPGKVHIRSSFIMNGVCVYFKGWFDLHRLDGIGCLEFDETTAQVEDKLMRETLARARIKLAEFEEKQRAWREDKPDGTVGLRDLVPFHCALLQNE